MLLFLLSIPAAQAVTISVSTQDTIPLGSTLEVDIVISDLGAGTAPSVGIYDLSLGYDPSLLRHQDTRFGNQLRLSGTESATRVQSGVGNVNVFELSFDDPATLDSSQADEFILTSLTFDTSDTGTSALTLRINVLGDAQGNPLPPDMVEDASVTITLVMVIPAVTPNQMSVANALNNACAASPGGGLGNTCNELRELVASGNPQAVAGALQQLAPEEVTAQGAAALETSTAQFTNIFTRLAELRGGAVGLISLKGLLLDQPGFSLLDARSKDRSLSGRGGGASADEESPFSRFGMFVSGRLLFGDQDATRNEPGFDFDTYGVTLGADYRLTDRWVLGAAAGYVVTDTNFDNNSGSLDVDGYSVSVYGTYYLERIFIEGIASAGWNNYDTRRRIAFGDIDETADGDTDSFEYSFSLGAGYDFTRGGLTFGPRGRVSHTRAEIDGYDEQDAGGNELSVDEQTVKSLTTSLGIQASYAISTRFGVVSPQALVEWEHEFKDDSRFVDYRFINDPTRTEARAVTDDPDRDRFNVGIGAAAVFGTGKSAFIYYETTFGEEDVTRHNISAGLRVEF